MDEMKQAYKILKDALKQHQKDSRDYGIRDLALDCDLPYTSVYNALKSKRKCNAQIWLQLMECLGAVKIEQKSIVMSGTEICENQELSQSSLSAIG